MFPHIGESNKTNKAIEVKTVLEPHNTIANNMCNFHELEPSVIPYLINQSMNPQLWNGSFCPISIFGINKYLEGNAKNIVCLLYSRIAMFIR